MALAIVLILALFFGDSAAAPSKVKESEYLLTCRPSCQRDASRAGLGHLDGVRRCDCYCRRVFALMTDQDVIHFERTGSLSEEVQAKQLRAFQACMPVQ